MSLIFIICLHILSMLLPFSRLYVEQYGVKYDVTIVMLFSFLD